MGRSLDISLAALCLVFAALAIWPWTMSREVLLPRPPAIAMSAGPVAEAELALPPLDSFRATLQRPLFSATRQPPVARPAPDTTGELILGRYRLTGVMIARDRTTVLLRPATGGKVIRLNQGQELDGWKVVSITADQIVLASAGKQQTIPLGGAPRAPEPGRGGGR